jgi:hypothetical protein
MAQNICTAAGSSAQGVGAVLGPPLENAAMSFLFFSMLCSCKKAIIYLLSEAYIYCPFC